MRSWTRTVLREYQQSIGGALRGSGSPTARYSQLRDVPPLEYGIVRPEHAAAFADRFVQLGVDDETDEFLQSCRRESWCWSMAARLVRMFLSTTDTNAVMHRGEMFVLSSEQAGRLLGRAPGAVGVLLDIGAGDGSVTRRLAPLFTSVRTTEVSRPMAWRLRRRGFECALTADPGPPLHAPASFDVVCGLNILDRVDDPMGMLRTMQLLLKPTGLILLAVVLPFGDFVEHSWQNRAPRHRLPMHGAYSSQGATWEQAVSVLVDRVFTAAGLEVVSVSRVPYLCRGDTIRSVYVLSDAVFVLRPKGPAAL